MALRIKQLLYKEMFTIAGARKKLQSEQREGTRPKVDPETEGPAKAPTLFDTGYEEASAASSDSQVTYTAKQRQALKSLAANLVELRELLKTPQV